MSIWIVTTGNSDVQLKHNYNSNKWQKRYREVRSELYNHLFEPYRLKNALANEPYSLPARVMGMVYGHELEDDTFNDLHFPLLDTFTNFLKGLTAKEKPEKIIVILTNQKNVFDDDDKINNRCPYWQDTCTLKPILEKYFQEKFPNFKGEVKYLELEPNFSNEGLDNWDKCLILINSLLQRNLTNINKKEKIFISHQAGTPAISSAVQFASLAKFEEQVEFLVSNEYQKEQVISIPSSNYLKGLKLQEAKELLDRYDYSGVDKIFAKLWKNQSLTDKEQKIKDLLAMAILWNNANFDEFAKARSAINEDAKKRTQEWWWTSYEAGYLAVIRLRQSNYVEALFHSFRAIEGLLRYMDKNKYEHKGIHDLIETILPDWKLSADIRNFKDHTSIQRNKLFHNLRGLEQKEVFQAWNTETYSNWQDRVRGCLNFITKQQFNSLEKASLMSSVHEELKTEINNYELQNECNTAQVSK
jgi:hypothetical protein